MGAGQVVTTRSGWITNAVSSSSSTGDHVGPPFSALIEPSDPTPRLTPRLRFSPVASRRCRRPGFDQKMGMGHGTLLCPRRRFHTARAFRTLPKRHRRAREFIGVDDENADTRIPFARARPETL